METYEDRMNEIVKIDLTQQELLMLQVCLDSARFDEDNEKLQRCLSKKIFDALNKHIHDKVWGEEK